MRRLLTSHPSARVTLSVFLGGALVVPAGVPATATPSPGVGAAARGTSSSMVTVATDPMRLKEVASKPARVQVSWKKTKKTKKYLVEAFSDARLKNLVTSKRTKKNTAWIGGGSIKENQKLWIRITTIDRPKKLKSAKLRVYTGVRTPAAPADVSVRPLSDTSARVTWAASTYATAYTVQLLPGAGAAPVWEERVNAPATAMDLVGIDRTAWGLPAQFAVAVKAERLGKTSATSAPVPAALPFAAPLTGPAFTVGVGSFNVLGVTYDDALGRSYWDRVPLLAANIQAMGADIVGIQEAAWSIKAGYPMRPVLALGLATGMAVAADPATGSECSTLSDHVLYNAALFGVETCGQEYLGIDAGFRRYVTWVQMRHLATGQGFLFGSTHLSVGGSASVNDLRLTETNLLLESLRVHNPTNLPVILTGDLNATAMQFPVTPPMVLAAGGFASADLVAAEVANIHYGSVHNFTATNTRGARIDYILTSPKVQVHQFSVQYAAPASVQPSDHYPVRATVTVYQ